MTTSRMGSSVPAVLAIASMTLILGCQPGAPTGSAPASASAAAAVATATPLAPSPVATAAPVVAVTASPRPTLPPLEYTQSHTSALYHYAAKFPSTWTLTAGTKPNDVDTIPDLGLGKADFYGDGVASGVMITSAAASSTRSDLATWSAFITTTVERQYGNYIGIANCYEPTRTLAVAGAPASEVDFVCHDRDWLWVTTVHNGLAFQIAWLDDSGWDPTYLRPLLDQFLAGFTFTK